MADTEITLQSLRAMAQLADQFPSAQILVIGRGSAQRRLEALTQQLGLAGRTRFTGFVSNKERDALLANSGPQLRPLNLNASS